MHSTAGKYLLPGDLSRRWVWTRFLVTARWCFGKSSWTDLVKASVIRHDLGEGGFPLWKFLISQEINAASLTVSERGLEQIMGVSVSQDTLECIMLKTFLRRCQGPGAAPWSYPVSAMLSLSWWLTYMFLWIYFATLQTCNKALGNLLPSWAASPEFSVWWCTSSNCWNYKNK